MKRALGVLSCCSLLAACGGGGGGDSGTDGGTATYTVSGRVPGTRIEAFCVDGSYYRTASRDDDNDGVGDDDDLDDDNDGIPDDGGSGNRHRQRTRRHPPARRLMCPVPRHRWPLPDRDRQSRR